MADSDSNFFDSDDSFDRLPDSLLLLIFNSVSDVKSLIRCRSLSKRFNSLIPQTDSLHLTIDCVISSDSDSSFSSDSFFIGFFKSILKSFFDLISPIQLHLESPQNSPTQILRQFDRIRFLEIDFPAGNLNLEKGAGVKWKAEFGNSLRSCVILMFRSIKDSDQIVRVSEEIDFIEGLKTKVFWTIRTLITASSRHYVLKEVVEEHEELERLILRDREGEGTVIMDKKGLEALRKEREKGEETVEECEWSRTRTKVPSARVEMRNQPWLELKGGVLMEDATMVIVRPTEEEEDYDDDVALRSFEGVYSEAVEALLKNGRRYQLEMNSF